MTSLRPTEHPPADLTGLHDLLWHLRHDAQLVVRLGDDPAGVCGAFDVPPDIARLLDPPDLRALLALGVNPYLLFFAALDLGIARADYYGQLAEGTDRG